MFDGALNLAPLLLAWLAVLLVVTIGAIRPGAASALAVGMTTLTFASVLWLWARGPEIFDRAWAPTLNLRLTFELDGLAALYALLASGIGMAVFSYSASYIPRHLEHHGRPAREIVRFHGFMLLFMAAMVGLVMAQDLILIFVFWDLTAIASYFLIGYDRDSDEAKSSALMAFLVTGVSSVPFMIGSAMLYASYDTFALPVLIERVQPGWYLTVAAGLMAVSGLAKSAQVPFHFWLPRAMAAPTPVSAYLHSAAMVAAGVFLLSRVYPLLQRSDLLLWVLCAVGLASMVIGGILALTADLLKRVLAYSTIAQYGYVVLLLGLGGPVAVAAACFYVIAHGLSKSALFLTAGAVTEASGASRLSDAGGLRRELPLLAAASGVAAAGLAALPLTIGFFKDELFFTAALEAGTPYAAAAVAGAALTLAYMWRFWSTIFLGERRRPARRLPGLLVWPIAVLGALVIAGGIVPGPAERLAAAAGEAAFHGPTPIHLAYHLDARTVNLMALATYGLGSLVVISRAYWSRSLRSVALLGQQFGPERIFNAGLAGLGRLSERMLDFEVRGLRRRSSTIFVPTAILIVAGWLAAPNRAVFSLGAVRLADLPLILVLLLAMVAALAAVRPTGHLSIALTLAGVGFCLTAVYALLGAPDVALVAVLVETVTSLFLIGILTLFSRQALAHASAADRPRQRRRWREPAIALGTGLGAFIVSWGALSRPSPDAGVASELMRLTPDAHATSVVTAILADFRGLDTAGEITVIVIVMVGIVTLLRAREDEEEEGGEG